MMESVMRKSGWGGETMNVENSHSWSTQKAEG